MTRMQKTLRPATIAAALVLAALLAGGLANSALASGSGSHKGHESHGSHGNQGDSDVGSWHDDSDSGRSADDVPELDPRSAGLAIALVAGGLAILRDRRRRR